MNESRLPRIRGPRWLGAETDEVFEPLPDALVIRPRRLFRSKAVAMAEAGGNGCVVMRVLMETARLYADEGIPRDERTPASMARARDVDPRTIAAALRRQRQARVLPDEWQDRVVETDMVADPPAEVAA